MAGLRAILTAQWRITWRELRKLNGLTANHLFLFSLLLPMGLVQIAFGLLLLFPLSADPMQKIPRERLSLWPLTSRQMTLLRFASVWLSPASWVVLLMLLWRSRWKLGIQLALIFLAVHLIAVAATALTRRLPQANPMRIIPALPGALGGLLRKNLREMLSVFDPYAGLILMLSGVAYRLFSRQPVPEATLAMTLLVVLSLSTYSQCLFALDGPAGFTRYRLWPLRGWQILGAKDAALLVVLAPLVLPLDPMAGFTAGFVALAFGHHVSVTQVHAQSRWQFVAGGSIAHGLVQTIAMFSAAVAAQRDSWLWGAAGFAAWMGSLAFYGWLLDRQLANRV